jgi:hypothetical protein
MAGLSAVGTVAATSAAGSMTRRVRVEDPHAGEDFKFLAADRGCVVTSELLVVGGAAHLVQLERPDPINDALVRLVGRAGAGERAAMSGGPCERMRPPRG